MFLYFSYVCFYIVVQYNNSNVQIFTLYPVYTVQKYPGVIHLWISWDHPY